MAHLAEWLVSLTHDCVALTIQWVGGSNPLYCGLTQFLQGRYFIVDVWKSIMDVAASRWPVVLAQVVDARHKKNRIYYKDYIIISFYFILEREIFTISI